jgi:hypothetical protein
VLLQSSLVRQPLPVDDERDHSGDRGRDDAGRDDRSEVREGHSIGV